MVVTSTRFVVVDVVKKKKKTLFWIYAFWLDLKVLTDWLIAVIFEGRL